MNADAQSDTRWRSPLARRLIVGVVLFSSMITLTLTALQLYVEYRQDVRGIESELEQIRLVHLGAIAQSLWATNTTELALQLQGLVQIPNIRHAAVYEGARLWGEAGHADAEQGIQRRYPIRYLHRGVNRQIGTLTVDASLDAIYARLLNRALVILASNALKTFLVAGFMLVFIHWLVTRHLQAVAGFLRRMTPGARSAPFALARKPGRVADELDELAGAVNRMHEDTQAAVEALRAGERRFHAIADYTVDWESWIGPDGHLLWVNASVERMTGYTPVECFAMPDYPLPMVHEEDRARVARLGPGAQRSASGENLEFRVRAKDGTLRWLALSWQPIYGPGGEFLGFRSGARDIGRLKEAEQALQRNVVELAHAENSQRRLAAEAREDHARLESLLAAMSFGVLFEDAQKRVLYHNPAFRRMWLIAEDVDLRGRETREVMRYSANVLARPDHFSRHILQALDAHQVSDTFEIVMADGRVVTQLSYPVRDHEGRFVGRLWIYEDVTRERQTAEQLIYLAERDSLSGLYNRHRFQEELSRTLADSSRRNAHGALLFFDLDEFKYVNDSFGHRAGDVMLIRVAGEIGALVRRNEILARLGGDEFAVLMPAATEPEAGQLAERIIRAISRIPFRFDNHNLRLTASLGIAMYPEHGANAEDLVAHADSAMYQAKEAGKNAWRLYRAERDAARGALGRFTWQERITNALERGLFRLHFQGVYRAADRGLSHLEALVRLVDEDRPGQVIMPGHFIGMAAKIGKIGEIDRWVIREAVRWLSQGEWVPQIAVNVSGRSFDDPHMPQFIAATLADAGVAARRLIIELTETEAVSDLHDAQRFIEALRLNGTSVCLDDFGTGFASFAYLKHLRAETLKIDGLFVRDLPNQHDNQVFVKSIVGVARGLRKTTIAEFVEDLETFEMLRGFGVDMMQGYFLDTPRPDHPALRG